MDRTLETKEIVRNFKLAVQNLIIKFENDSGTKVKTIWVDDLSRVDIELHIP